MNVDGTFDKVAFVDDTQDEGRIIKLQSLDAGRPITAEDLPTQLKCSPPSKYPYADYMWTPKNTAFVSPKFKNLVERFEPSVHQFFEMATVSGKRDTGSMFWFIVCNRIGALDPDACIHPIKEGDRLYT